MMSAMWALPIFLLGVAAGVWLTKVVSRWVDEVTREAFENVEVKR